MQEKQGWVPNAFARNDIADVIENGELTKGGRGDILIRDNGKLAILSSTRDKNKTKFLLTAFVEY
jgi:hypothetical protein